MATPEKRRELRENLVIFQKYQEKEKALKKAGEHRKKKELWYNTKKMWSSLGKAGEIGENTGKRWRNTRETWRAEKAGEHRKNEELLQHRKNGENFEKVWCFFENSRKRKKLRKKLVNTGKTRSFLAAPGKRGELPESLVKLKKNPVFLF